MDIVQEKQSEEFPTIMQRGVGIIMDGDGSTSALFIPLIIILFLIIVSAFFSFSETVLTGANKLRLKTLSEAGNKRAKTALKLSERLDKTLTASLVGNTVANIAMGSVATILAANIGINEAAMTAVITIIVILFAEVLPKTVAKMKAESYLIAIVPVLKIAFVLLSPISFIFSLISKFVNGIFKFNPEPTVTEEDVYDIIESMEEEGNYDTDETNLLYSAYEFGKFTVKDIMTDKSDIVYVDISMPQEQMATIVKQSTFSRLPVIDGNINKVLGVVRVRAYLEKYLSNQKIDLMSIMDKALYVREDTNVDLLLSQMKSSKIHIAIVRNSSGRTTGLVTMEDMLEELVGEIWDENEDAESDFKKLSDDKYLIAADLSVVSAFELIDFDNFDREETGHMTLLTWAEGLVGHKLKKAEQFSYNNLEFKVVRKQNNQVMLEVSILEQTESEEEEVDE